MPALQVRTGHAPAGTMMLPTGSVRALEATLALRASRAVPWLHLCCDMMTVAPWTFPRLHLETRSGAVWYVGAARLCVCRLRGCVS